MPGIAHHAISAGSANHRCTVPAGAQSGAPAPPAESLCSGSLESGSFRSSDDSRRWAHSQSSYTPWCGWVASCLPCTQHPGDRTPAVFKLRIGPAAPTPLRKKVSGSVTVAPFIGVSLSVRAASLSTIYILLIPRSPTASRPVSSHPCLRYSCTSLYWPAILGSHRPDGEGTASALCS